MGAARQHLREGYGGSGNALLSHSHLERAVTVNGVCHKRPTINNVEDIADHLFFSKVDDRFVLLFTVLTEPPIH